MIQFGALIPYVAKNDQAIAALDDLLDRDFSAIVKGTGQSRGGDSFMGLLERIVNK